MNKRWTVKRDGVTRFQGTETECWQYMHTATSCSIDHATKYEGWSLTEDAS